MPPQLWGFVLFIIYCGLLVSLVSLKLKEDDDRRVQREMALQRFLDMLSRIRALLAGRNTAA